MTASLEQIAVTAAAQLLPGEVVYLGPGLPLLVAGHLPRHWGVTVYTEAGLLAGSPAIGSVADALATGAGSAIVECVQSAGLIRGGHLDVAVLQARQVSTSGDLSEPANGGPGPGRSSEVGSCAQRVFAVMELAGGSGSIVGHCDGPISVQGRVGIIISDVGVFTITSGGLTLTEVAPGWTVDQVRQLVEPTIDVLPNPVEMTFTLPQREPHSKVFSSAAAAVADIPDGSTILIDGFAGPGGMAAYLMLALRDQGANDLTMVSNTAGIAATVGFGTPPGSRTIDHSVLVLNGQIKKALASFPVSPSPSRPTPFELAYLRGEVDLELVPQGTLAERIRAGGFGIAAFYTPTGAGTAVAEGKPTRTIDGREQVLESGIQADFALLRALRADTMGNLVYHGTSRNFNAVMAPAARVTIVEVDEIVEPGQLSPEAIVTPGAFVQRVVQRPADFSAYEVDE